MWNPVRKTVASVMGSFQKTVDDLKAVHAAHTSIASKLEDKIEKLLDKVEAHSFSADQAKAEAGAALMLAEKIASQFHLTI